jgi:hypothetical protein
MEKVLVTSKEEFIAHLNALERVNKCDTSAVRNWPPTAYPCVVICYSEGHSGSLTWKGKLSTEYVYLRDFGKYARDY